MSLPPINPNQLADAFGALSVSSSGSSSSQAPQMTAGLTRVLTVTNAHDDDIHALIRLSDQTFVTGSKDGSLKKWNFAKRDCRSIMDPGKIDYRNWITALAVLNDESWISGNRRGEVTQWKTDGSFVSELEASPSQPKGANHKCKERNLQRVNCLSSFTDESSKPYFFAGWPTQFTLHDYTRRTRVNFTRTCDNDWVYAVRPVTKTKILVVTGCRLDLWGDNPQTHRWDLQNRLIVEDKTTKPRPYISAITPIEGTKSSYGLAVFDGSVRVMDIEVGKAVFHSREHVNRVWTIENTQPNCFASCGDDGTIRFWDPRQGAKSTLTVRENVGVKARVSVLHRYGEHQLLSGSCPDFVRGIGNKAQICIWDLRRLPDTPSRFK